MLPWAVIYTVPTREGPGRELLKLGVGMGAFALARTCGSRTRLWRCSKSRKGASGGLGSEARGGGKLCG